MPSKGGIQMGRSGSSGGRSTNSPARAGRAGVITLGNGRYRVPGLDRIFTSFSAATSVAETRQSQQRSAEGARFR